MRSSDWSSDVCSSDLVGICEGSVERKRQSGCRNDSCLQLNAPNSFIGRVDAYGLAGRIIGYALGNAGRHYVEELQRALVFAVERGDIQPSADASGLPIPFGADLDVSERFLVDLLKWSKIWTGHRSRPQHAACAARRILRFEQWRVGIGRAHV